MNLLELGPQLRRKADPKRLTSKCGRYYLRAYRAQDQLEIQDWLQDVDIASFAFGRAPDTASLQELVKLYLDELHSNRRFVFVLVAQWPTNQESADCLESQKEQVLGFVRYSLYPKSLASRFYTSSRWARIGIMIGLKRAWGKGIGTIAVQLLSDFLFQEKQIARIDLDTAVFNTRAQRCFEKCGFHPYQIDSADSRYGQIFMELTRPSWEAQRNSPSWG